jgi:predicted nucleotidyltransferase
MGRERKVTMELYKTNIEKPHEQEILDKLVSFLVAKISPEKIVLFGSRARGDHRDDSDYDFLVIMNIIENKIAFTSNLYSELWDRNDLPENVDFLAITSERYDELKDCVGYVYKTIDREGIVLYEKQLP